MSFDLISNSGDLNNVVNDVNKVIIDLKGREQTEIFKDETGTRRVLLGKGKDGFYGLRVSKPGFDVYDGDASDLAFNSDQNAFKIVQTGTTTIPGFNVSAPPAGQYTGGSTGITLDHDLGFVPVVIAAVLYGTTYVTIPYSATSYSANTGAWLNFWSSADTTQVSFVQSLMLYNTAGTAGAIPVRYYLLQESAAVI